MSVLYDAFDVARGSYTPMIIPVHGIASSIPLTAFASRWRAAARARTKRNYPSLPTRVVNYILGIGAFAVSNDAVSYLR